MMSEAAARDELDGATHAGRVYGGIMRPMPAGPGTSNAPCPPWGGGVPRTRGDARRRPRSDEVTIGRDRWGIDHIEAAHDADAWFGLGFLSCPGDCGFQLEILARAGRGLLAELLEGRRRCRSTGFAHARLSPRGPGPGGNGSTPIPPLAPRRRGGEQAGQAGPPRPHELVLLRGTSRRWAVEDILAFLGLQSLALAGGWDTELARLAILRPRPRGAGGVDPPPIPGLPVVSPPGAMADRDPAWPATWRGFATWSVRPVDRPGPSPARERSPAPRRTPTIRIPWPRPFLRHWYLVHTRTPDWELAGASFVGGPALPMAYNGHAAWGIGGPHHDSPNSSSRISDDGTTAHRADRPSPSS